MVVDLKLIESLTKHNSTIKFNTQTLILTNNKYSINMSENKKKYKVHSLERGLELIEVLADLSIPTVLSDISNAVGFNISTTHRILDSLKFRGYVIHDKKTSKYSLSLKLFEIANKIGCDPLLRSESEDILQHIAIEAKASAFLIVKDGNEALCLERTDGNPSIRILALEKGSRMPLHMGGGPLSILAFQNEAEINRIIKIKGLPASTAKTITNPILLKKIIKDIRQKGYSMSIEDVTDGVAAIGYPVFDSNNKVIAAISLSGLVNDFSGENRTFLLDLLKKASLKLSDRICFSK